MSGASRPPAPNRSSSPAVEIGHGHGERRDQVGEATRRHQRLDAPAGAAPDGAATGRRVRAGARVGSRTTPAGPTAVSRSSSTRRRRPGREPRSDHRSHRGRHVPHGHQPRLGHGPSRAEVRGRLGAAAAQHHGDRADGHAGRLLSRWASARADSAPVPASVSGMRRGTRRGFPVSSMATNTTCAVWVWRRSPVLTVSAIDLHRDVHRAVADEVHRRLAGHERADPDPLTEVHPVDARGYGRTAGVPDRGHRRRLVHQRHQLAAEQVAEDVLHVRHDERGNRADGVGHRAGGGMHGQVRNKMDRPRYRNARQRNAERFTTVSRDPPIGCRDGIHDETAQNEADSVHAVLPSSRPFVLPSYRPTVLPSFRLSVLPSFRPSVLPP